jgi:hypothetical protein
MMISQKMMRSLDPGLSQGRMIEHPEGLASKDKLRARVKAGADPIIVLPSRTGINRDSLRRLQLMNHR